MDDVAYSLTLAGDALQHAWRADLAKRERRILGAPRRSVIVVIAIALMLGAGAALGASLFKNPSDEQTGLIEANTLFAGSSPSCVSVAVDEFRCSLASPPTGETFYDATGQQLLNVFNGIKVTTTNEAGYVDGGCVSQGADGLNWNCFLGQAAVEHGILSSQLLGQRSPGPAAG